MVPNTQQGGQGTIAIGDKDAQLECDSTHAFLDERYGQDSGEVTMRINRVTPNLQVAMIISEAEEVCTHGYSTRWSPEGGRSLISPGVSGSEAQEHRLFMSKGQLGWLKVRPVTDPAKQKEYLRLMRALNKPQLLLLSNGELERAQLMVLGDGVPKTLGMGSQKLEGVELLRRVHIVLGSAMRKPTHPQRDVC